ncbi:UNVERIFIED_CONTAM: hypothetical protein GTU68_052106 [Idotea baltica]|nr:hypothetical protein [Idotea baltica]
MLNELPPLALYIHIPWCIQKCPYCDFNSHARAETLPEDRYIDALLNDLSQQISFVQNRSLVSIFFGGGTPSLFSAKSFDRLLTEIEKLIPFSFNIEISLEANPSTFEINKFSDYKKAGINRLSIGIQSFQTDKLVALGRVHSSKEALIAIDNAHEAGFDNFNIDLMHGLPNQSVSDALADIATAINYAPSHISWYQLTLEPNTIFWRYPPNLPSDEALWEIQAAGQDLLEKHQYKQYEVSAYAQKDKQARHNINYWSFGDFIGIGAGAHGKITFDDGNIIRLQNVRQPESYLDENSPFFAQRKAIAINELPFEFLMNALRLTQGVPRELFFQRTGLPLKKISATLKDACNKGLLADSSKQLVATRQGQLFLNDLLQFFLP